MLFDLPDYHCDPAVLHVGCEEPRAYFVPFPSEHDALCGHRGQSTFYKSIDGEWSFRYFHSLNDVLDSDITGEGFKTADFDRITVPMSWQMALGRGYDVPSYTNFTYPIPVDPPYTPDENPCAVYVRDFTIPSAMKGKKVYLNFEGVDSAFYVWVNDVFAAYSQVSHLSTEIDVTRLVRGGRNTLKVLVLKWSDGTYLEDQDM